MMPKAKMTTADILDGKALAKALRASIKSHVKVLKEDHGIDTGLAVVLVGDDPASQVYVRSKEKAATEVGIKSFVHHLPQNTSQDEILSLIRKLNKDKKVSGILVQLPLPRQIDVATVFKELSPEKDVDGLTVESAGRLVTGMSGLVPCTPLGCLFLLRQTLKNLSGLHAVVIGCSNLVGRPMGQLLLKENCTVTMAHSRTRDLNHICRPADILIVAAGKPNLVKGDWIKPGAIVIDVGINRVDGKLVGDVDFDQAVTVAGHITPVPGGVGPLTVACLLGNTVTAACRQHELTVPDFH